MGRCGVFGCAGLQPFVQVGVGALRGPQMNPRRDGLGATPPSAIQRRSISASWWSLGAKRQAVPPSGSPSVCGRAVFVSGVAGKGGWRGVFWGWRIGSLSDASKKLFGIGLKICYLIRTSIMGSLKKRRKAKINKHKRRKKLRLNRHKKRTWQK